MSSNQAPGGKRDGPSLDPEPGDCHSGEGLASVRPRLAKTLADAALLSGQRQGDAMITRIAQEPSPEPDDERPLNADPQ